MGQFHHLPLFRRLRAVLGGKVCYALGANNNFFSPTFFFPGGKLRRKTGTVRSLAILSLTAMDTLWRYPNISAVIKVESTFYHCEQLKNFHSTFGYKRLTATTCIGK